MGFGSTSGEPQIVERTFEFGQRVRRLCRFLAEQKSGEGDLANQLKRSGSAIGALVEEGQGGESKKDFLHKMNLAYKEAREAFYWLRQLAGTGAVDPKRIAGLTDEARQLKLILAKIVSTTRKSIEASEESEEPVSEETSTDDE